MGKIASFVIFFVFLSTLFLGTASAQIIDPIRRTTVNNPVFGQDHNYSVFFRGNGEAVVTLKTTFTNQSDKEIDSQTFTSTILNPQEVVAFQVVTKPVCAKYETTGSIEPVVSRPEVWLPSSGVNLSSCRSRIGLFSNPVENSEACYGAATYSPSGGTWYQCLLGYENLNNKCVNSKTKETKCVEYERILPAGFNSGNVEFQKAEIEQSGENITVKLPQTIKPDEQASLLLYYRGFGSAVKDIFGKYNYNFESLKIEDKIQNLTVGISSEPDIKMTGKSSGSVDYNVVSPSSFSGGGVALSADVQFSSAELSSSYRQTGQGSIRKSTSNLLPMESYIVKGSFADSWLKLYSNWIIIGAIVLILVILLTVLLIRFISKRLNKPNLDSKGRNISPSLLMIIASGASASLMVLYTILIFSVNRLSFYRYRDAGMLFYLLFILISLLVYGTLLIFPGLMIGVKKGALWGFATFGLTVLFLIVVVAIVLAIMIANSSGITPYYAL